MSCTHPKTAYFNPNASIGSRLLWKLPTTDIINDYSPIPIPCKRCDACQKTYARDWGVRAFMEMHQHEKNCFLTLTYDEDNIHESLQPDHMTKFLKRLRHAVAPLKIRYIQCGEYGSKGHRAHHHALIFGYDFDDKVFVGKSDKDEEMFSSVKLDKLWGKGFCTIGEANIKTALYISGYIGKKIYGTKDTDGFYVSGGSKNTHYNKVDKETGEVLIIHKEYMTMSKKPGLGHSFFTKFTTDLFPDGKILVPSAGTLQEYPVPQYFFNKLAETNPNLFIQSRDLRLERALEYELKHKNESSPERLRTKAFIAKKEKNKLGRPLDGIEPSHSVDMTEVDKQQALEQSYQDQLNEQQKFEQKNKHHLQYRDKNNE